MIYGIQIFSPESKLQKTSETPLRLPGVKIGQLIRARILELLPHGGVRLMVAGQKLVAKTDLSLTPGTDLLLEVGREKGGLSLKPVSGGRGTQPQSFQPSLTSAGSGKPASLASLFSRINDHLPELGKLNDPAVRGILHTLALKSGTRDNQILPRILENLGLALEKKIGTLVSGSKKNTAGPAMKLLAMQDLKAAILHLISTETKEPAAKPLRGISSALESLQQLNTQGESSRFLLPFPVLTGDIFEFGQLFINTGEKGKQGEEKENRVIQIAFLMNMTSLGSVRADFSILKKEITGRFMLEDQSICDYIRSLIPELRQRLLSLDYKAGSIECRVGSKRALSPDALVRSMAGPAESRGLDLVI